MAVQISGNDITVPRDGTFTRNVTIGGTLTYEDVTNIDSVGLITARTGIEIGARPGVAASISVDGNMIVSGISTFGGDVQVSDKIIHSGDTDTAIRFSGADTITAETGGSSRFKIDSSGNVTIGNDGDSGSNPSSGYDELCIEGGNEAIGMCFLSPAANDVEQTIAFGDSNNNQSGKIQYEHANDAMHFDTAGSERLRITSAGNLGLGYNSPSQRLVVHAGSDNSDVAVFTGGDVARGLKITTSAASGPVNDGVVTLNAQTSSVGEIAFATAGSERMRIDSSGLVGVNQTNPSFTMDLKRAGTDIIRMNNSGETTHGNADAKLVAGGTYYQNMDFHAYLYKFQTYNGSSLGERLRLTHDGKMGLGTGTPADAFHIHYGTDPSLNLFSTQHTQNTGSKINFGVGQSASSGGNTATRIESNIPSAGGAMTGELKFYTNNGDSLAEAVRIEKIGQVLGKASFVSKTTAVYNANVSTASGFTADAYNIVLAEDVLTNHSVYIVNFSWNHDGSGQPYLIDGAFVFQPGATNPGSAGAMGPGFAPVQGAHTEQGTSKYFNFRYYSPTGSHVHGLQAASTVSLNDTYGRGYLQIKIFQIGAETTI